MALINDVAAICNRLAPQGWAELLARHGLDITAGDLAIELARELPVVDRSVAGFEDFALEGRRGIEPGHPARSLLFHALASSNVLTRLDGSDLGEFPTLAEIDTVENYVYGARRASLNELGALAGSKFAIAVFAFEYRPASHTCHRKHADLCFARTGVARVGTAPPLYDKRRRGFLPFKDDDPFAIRVLPGRYAAYLAVRQPGNRADFCPMRFRESNQTESRIGDDARSFWVPLHKLFSGDECLRDVPGLQVALNAHHVNEKLRRIHLELGRRGNTGWHEPDISNPPFRYFEGIGEWASDAEHGPGILAPVPHDRLIEVAEYNGTPLWFNVLPGSATLDTSLAIPAQNGARHAPEYVNARHVLMPTGETQSLNERNIDIEDAIRNGGYRAMHYVDFTGDGFIQASCPQLAAQPANILESAPIPAYSLVTAPDFFPNCDQRESTEWAASLPPALRESVWQVPPETLSDQRLAPNLQLPGNPFSPEDDTVTAVVSLFGEIADAQTNARPADAVRHSPMPDDAAGVFAPGWDVSRDVLRDEQGNFILNASGQRINHLAAYGLGSPFPEDAKLCAALSTFWPAVAPDATRGMEPRLTAITVSPLTDEEIGRVGSLPWDGVAGPQLIGENNRNFVEYAGFAHVDYVDNALEGRFTLALTGHVGIAEYQNRVLAMTLAYLALHPGAAPPLSDAQKRAWLVLSFRRCAPGEPELQQAQQQAQTLLMGETYRFEMFTNTFATGEATVPPNGDFRKRRVPLRNLRTLFVDPDNRRVLLRAEQGAWQRIALTGI